MLAIVYLNGAYKNKNEATISVSDRGFLFGDSVYDSTAVIDGKLIDFDKHFNNISHAMEELHYVKKIKTKATSFTFLKSQRLTMKTPIPGKRIPILSTDVHGDAWPT